MSVINNPRDQRVPCEKISERAPASDSRNDVAYASQELFKGVREITITHAGASYRLRITHANKLILTK
jgi:hemin uptake protein HemP